MEKSISGTDLVKIIEVCGQNGVQHLKMGDTEITFSGFVFQKKTDYPESVEPVLENDSVDPNFKLEDEIKSAQNDTDLLIIEDPLAYEELLSQGEELEEDESGEE